MRKFLKFVITAGVAVTITALSFVCAHPVSSVQEEYRLSTVDIQSTEPVVLKINGKYLNSKYAPYISNETTMVPVRDVMEQLGWKVEWNDTDNSIVITRGAKKITMQIGSDKMIVDKSTHTLPSVPVLVGKTSYIPIRAVSEALGATVGWDPDNNTAGIYTKYTTSILTIGEYKVKVGATTGELISKCGNPTYKTIGDNGLVWYVYSKYPAAFMAVATDGGIVCGYYTNSYLFSTWEGYVYGTHIKENSGEYKLIDKDNYTTGLYYDKKAGILCGINYMLKGFSSYHNTNTVLQNQARMGLDILNSFRYANGKSALKWNVAAASSCAGHARYMAEVGSLTHTGADGSSALDRYLKYQPGANWKSWGENICAEADNIFTCMNGWINSDYHHSLMLSDKKEAGIGFIYSPNGKYKYCTVMFLLK